MLDKKEYNLYNLLQEQGAVISGRNFSFKFKDKTGIKESTVNVVEDNFRVDLAHTNVNATKKKILFNFMEDYDFYQKSIYTIFEMIKDEDDSFERPSILGTREIEEYKLNKVYSRISGPAIIDSGFINYKGIDSSPKEIWAYKGKICPDWIPKIKDKKQYENWSIENILKTTIQFDMKYGLLLKSLYENNALKGK